MLERAQGAVDFNRNGAIDAGTLLESVAVTDVIELSGILKCQLDIAAEDILQPRSDRDWLADNYCFTLLSPNWDLDSCAALAAAGGAPIVEPTIDQLEALLEPFPVDCNADGVSDEVQLDEGSARDSDGDGLLDVCEPVAGDCDGDEDVDDDELDVLVAAFGRSEGEAEYRECVDLDLDQDVTFVDSQLWVDAQTRPVQTRCPSPAWAAVCWRPCCCSARWGATALRAGMRTQDAVMLARSRATCQRRPTAKRWHPHSANAPASSRRLRDGSGMA